MKITLDRKQFASAASELKNAEEVVARAQYRAINKVAEKTLTRSRREIVSRVNLTQTYVRERMGVRKATPSRLEAVIYARTRPTRLATYGARQVVKTAKRAKGDKLRGIRPGMKQAGATVHVVRANGRKRMPGTFFLPLRAGKAAGGNGMGLFWRYGKEIEHLYGPSVDNEFRYVVDRIDEEVKQELADAISKQTDYEIRKALRTK